MKKRKRRTVNIRPGSIGLEGTVLVLSEWRGGTEHFVRVELGHDNHRTAERIHDACVSHVRNVREHRARLWRWVDEVAKKMGVAG